jgi:hypothetical protein
MFNHIHSYNNIHYIFDIENPITDEQINFINNDNNNNYSNNSVNNINNNNNNFIKYFKKLIILLKKN